MWTDPNPYADQTVFDRAYTYVMRRLARAWRQRPRNPWPEMFFALGALLIGFGFLFLFQLLLTPMNEAGVLHAQLVCAAAAFGAGQFFLKQQRLARPEPVPVPVPVQEPVLQGAGAEVPVQVPATPVVVSSDRRRRPDTRACLEELRTAGVNVKIARVLVGAGFDSAARLSRASDEALLSVHGVGPATVRKIRACFGER